MLGTTKEKTGSSFVTRTNEGVLECDVAFTDKLDLLFEKRHTIREAALTAINTTLCLRSCGPCMEPRQEVLAEALQRILQRAEVTESLLALRCISLSSLALYEGLSFKKQMVDTLTKLIKDQTHAVDPAVRAAAIDALAIVAFMHSADSDHTIDTSYTFSGIFYEETAPGNVIRAAIDGWSLLLSITDDSVLEESLFPENIDKLNEFLDHNDSEVRVSAGKAIALAVEGLRDNLKQDASEYDVIELNSIDSPVGWDEIMGKLDFLSSEKSKGQSKTEGKAQKKIFRQLISSIESGEAPHESLMIRDVQLDLDGWASVTQLDRIRSYFGEGFIYQMANNNNLMQIFDYHVNPDPEPAVQQFTKKERRRSVIEAEKEKTKYMGATRKHREFARDLAGFSSE